MNFKKYILIIFLFSVNFLFSQNREKAEWFSIGYGHGYKYFSNDIQGINFSGCLNTYSKKTFFHRAGLDVTYVPTTYNDTGLIIGNKRNLWNFNYSPGLYSKNKYSIFTMSVGPSLVYGRRNDNTSFISIGFTANICLTIRILKDLAIGAELFSNSNFTQSTHGFRIVIMGTGKGFSD